MLGGQRNPPFLSRGRLNDKPIFQYSPEEKFVISKVDEICANFRSVTGWDLYPPFHSAVEMHLSNRLRRAELKAEEDLEGAKGYLAIPNKLLEDLMTVKIYDKDLFNDFIDEMDTMDFESYYGVRTEVAAARVLIKKGIDFTHPDPPDFEFNYSNIKLKLECTAGYIVSTDDYLQKICNKINDKSAKPYADGNTILMFDISSIIHRVIGDGLNPAFHSLKHRILDDAEIFDWSIGSVILICYLLDPEQDIFRRIYHRCDTENISFELNDFLNEHYEFGDQSLKEFYIPGEI